MESEREKNVADTQVKKREETNSSLDIVIFLVQTVLESQVNSCPFSDSVKYAKFPPNQCLIFLGEVGLHHL